jgi:soluble lytic murein transglycosylase
LSASFEPTGRASCAPGACQAPQLEVDIVQPVAQRYGLPPWLPFAIMKAESAFDARATSVTNARGLMQIMPAECGRLHAAAALPGDCDPDDLYTAPYNALLGTTELGLKSMSLTGTLTPDHLPAVIASYNAGEEAVRRWFDEGIPTEADAFSESIPFTETRRYVRTVLGYLMEQRVRYGDP